MSTEHLIHTLADHVRALVRAQEASTKELAQFVAPIKELPPLLKEQLKVLEQRFVEQLQGMAQLELMRVQAETGVHQKLLSVLQNSLDDASVAYAEDIEKLVRRYTEIQKELSAAASERIRQLDAPALDLMELDLEDQVLKWVKEYYIPRSELLDVAFTDGITSRASQLAGYVDKIRVAIEDYFASRQVLQRLNADYGITTAHNGFSLRGVPTFFVEEKAHDGKSETTFYLAPTIGDKLVNGQPSVSTPGELRETHELLSVARLDTGTIPFFELLAAANLQTPTADFLERVERAWEGTAVGARLSAKRPKIMLSLEDVADVPK